MPQGDSFSDRKLFLPKPQKSTRKRRATLPKKRSASILKVEAHQLIEESHSHTPSPSYQRNNNGLNAEKTELITYVSEADLSDEIRPKEFDNITSELGLTEQIPLSNEEERTENYEDCTEIIQPVITENNVITHTTIDKEEEEITEKLEVTERTNSIPLITQPIIYASHQQELRHLFLFGCTLFIMGLLPYSSSAFADFRAWNKGEPIPLISMLLSTQTVVEDSQGNVVLEELPPDDPLMNIEEEIDTPDEPLQPIVVDIQKGFAEPEKEPLANAVDSTSETIPTIASDLSSPEPRYPAQPSPIIIPPGAMDNYFQKLWEIEQGQDTIARALIWGDSTIAADGIVKDVRKRMQTRFGNAGSGFLPIALNSAWTIRKEILRKSSGWLTSNYVYGKLSSKRYGLAGMVSSTSGVGTAVLAGPKTEGSRLPSTRYQIFYQAKPNGGSFVVDIGDGPIEIETDALELEERTHDLYASSGSEQIKIESKGNGEVTIYGVALESKDRGVTWETLAVAGSSITSMRKQDATHMHTQVAHRDPALIAYWTGGNELGYPALRSSSGKGYKKVYRTAVKKIRDGHPDASCLLIGPLDQGIREGGFVKSKPTLAKLIRFQKEVALELGCAYWDAQDAMGGNNSFSTWMNHSPKLANPDLSHLTGRGRKIIGETLADVIEYNYNSWLEHHPNGIE